MDTKNLQQTNGNISVSNGQQNNSISMMKQQQQQQQQQGGVAAQSNKSNLLVNYLPQSMKEQDFNMLFSKVGPVKSCRLMYDRQTGTHTTTQMQEKSSEQNKLH
jgi:RNA recognition motif-containing protein